jgi:hypothetical protein
LYGRQSLGRTNKDYRVYLLVRDILRGKGIARYDVLNQINLVNRVLGIFGYRVDELIDIYYILDPILILKDI